jgi:hypothetical protein
MKDKSEYLKVGQHVRMPLESFHDVAVKFPYCSGVVHLVGKAETEKADGLTACHLDTWTCRRYNRNDKPNDYAVDEPVSCLYCAAGIPWPDA